MQHTDLKFLRDYGPYNKDTVASFTADAARIIIGAGAAVVQAPVAQIRADIMPERKSTKIVKK